MKQTASFLKDITKAKFVNVDKEESKFEKTINRYFKAWEAQIQSNVNKYYPIIQKAQKEENPEELIAKFRIGDMPKNLASLASAVAQRGLERAYADLDAVLSFDIDMTPIADYYLQHYGDISKILSDNLQSKIKEVISDSIKEGSSTEDVHKKISEIFQGPVPIKVPEKIVDEKIIRRAYEYNMDKDVYTTMLARTEIQRALNNGRIYGYQESQGVKSVRWITNPGACEFCQPRNGAIYSVDEAQDLIPLHPNCKCTFVVSEYKSFDEAQQGPDQFADPEKIYADPNGVGLMDFFKLNDEEYDKVLKLIDEGKESEALKILKSKLK